MKIFKTKFPHAAVSSRPCRLLEATERIAAPLSKGTITHDADYLDSLWIPKIRRQASMHKLSQISAW